MIRSDVGDTTFCPPVLRGPELGAVVSTTCLEAVFTDRDFRFFVTTRPLGTAR